MTTSIPLLAIGTSNILAWVLPAEQVPQTIAQGLLAITNDPHLILLLINPFLLAVGVFMEGGAAIIILAPVLSQVATSVGIHPLHFDFVVALNIVIGLLTPPLGVWLFVVCGLAASPSSGSSWRSCPSCSSRLGRCRSSATSP